jgi:hypothetical protein
MLRRIKFILSILILILIAPAGFMVTGASAQDEPPAEEYIPEGDPTPPPPLAVRNPDLVVIPSGEAQVYMVPTMSGVYFYDGYWYRHHHGVWFRAGAYNDPWAFVQPPMVPSFVTGIPPAYPFYLPRGYHRIHYGEFHSHWHAWDRDRHWHKQHWFQHERRADVRQARERQAHVRMEKERHLRQERVRSDKVGYKQRLADHTKHDKSAHSDKNGKIDKDKGGKLDKTGKLDKDKTGRVDKDKGGKLDKTGKLDKDKTGRIDKDKGGKVDKAGKLDKGRTGRTDKTGSTGNTTSKSGATRTDGIKKTGSTTTKTGGTTKVNNQPKPQPQQRVKPKPQPRPQPKPQPKPQPREQKNKDNVR